MMRPVNDSFSGQVGLFAVATLTILLAFSGCESRSAGEMPLSRTGAIAFKVEWEPPPDDAPVLPSADFAQSPPRISAIDVCVDYGIDTVTMQVMHASDVLVEQAFPCGNHAGTLSGVPAGDNLVLRLQGGSGGTISWNGQSEAFPLAAGTTYDAGMITMFYTGLDNVAPTVVNVTPKDNAVNVSETSSVLVRFSEPMAINTVIDNGAIQILEEGIGPVEGLISYSSAEQTAVFDPVNPLSSGKRFSVLLNPEIQDMAGNPIGSTFSSGFFTRFRGEWGFPARIENIGGDTGNGAPPYIGVDFNENGDAFVVWQKNVNTTIFVYGARYSETNNSWSSTSTLSPTSLFHSFAPRVEADNTGNAIAVWQQFDLGADAYRVLASRYSLAASAWSEAAFIDTGQGSGTAPSIVMLNNGDALVSYVSFDSFNNNNNIFVSRYLSNTGEWEPGFIRAGGNGCAGPIDFNEIASTQNGEYLIVHVCGNSVFASGSLLGGTGTATNLGSTSFPSKVSAAVDDNGNAVVVWDSSDGTVWSSFYTSLTNSWSGPTMIRQGLGAANPSVAMTDGGDIVTVWGGNNDNVYSSHATISGQTWGIPVLLMDISGNAGFARRPALAMDPDGNAIAVWSWRDDIPLQYSIFAKRYDSAAKAWSSSPTTINEPNDLGVIFPEVSLNGNGDAVAVWFVAEDTGTSIDYFVNANFRYK